MPIRHTVQKGECIEKIAAENGLLPEAIWAHPDNDELRELRHHRNSLVPAGEEAGAKPDVVIIPDKEPETYTRDTGKRHTWVRKGIPAKLHLQLVDEDDGPRAGLSYKLEVGDKVAQGKTDGEGWLREWIPARATIGTLTLEDDEVYRLALGGLADVSTASGVRARLRNLGYLLDGDLDEDWTQDRSDGEALPGEPLDLAYVDALERFQEDHDLPVTGEADDETRWELVELHGS